MRAEGAGGEWPGHPAEVPGRARAAAGLPHRAMAWAPRVAGWLGGFLLVPALGMIPPPENVRMNSVNFKNILQWEVPAFPQKNLTFTAQYESYWYFQDRCKNIASTQCDFSVLSKYGDHTVRVRTEFADEHSEWVNITFCPVEDTIIGPPEMQIESLADSFHMRFSAPQIENEPETWTMKNIYNSWAYRVQYWKNGTNEKFHVISQYDSEVLRDLEPWTTYCIQVQGFLLNQNRTGEWSKPVCERTSNDETTPSWIVAIILIVSVLVVFLCLLGCFGVLWFIYKKTKYTFHSGTSLPQHLKEVGRVEGEETSLRVRLSITGQHVLREHDTCPWTGPFPNAKQAKVCSRTLHPRPG